jgi:hypothetical protein
LVGRFRDSKTPTFFKAMADCLLANPPYRVQLFLMNTKEIHGRSIILMSVRLVMDDAKIKT